jgi:hypothetical protein
MHLIVTSDDLRCARAQAYRRGRQYSDVHCASAPHQMKLKLHQGEGPACEVPAVGKLARCGAAISLCAEALSSTALLPTADAVTCYSVSVSGAPVAAVAAAAAASPLAGLHGPGSTPAPATAGLGAGSSGAATALSVAALAGCGGSLACQQGTRDKAAAGGGAAGCQGVAQGLVGQGPARGGTGGAGAAPAPVSPWCAGLSPTSPRGPGPSPTSPRGSGAEDAAGRVLRKRKHRRGGRLPNDTHALVRPVGRPTGARAPRARGCALLACRQPGLGLRVVGCLQGTGPRSCTDGTGRASHTAYGCWHSGGGHNVRMWGQGTLCGRAAARRVPHARRPPRSRGAGAQPLSVCVHVCALL